MIEQNNRFFFDNYGGGQPHFCRFLPMPMLPKMEKAG